MSRLRSRVEAARAAVDQCRADCTAAWSDPSAFHVKVRDWQLARTNLVKLEKQLRAQQANAEEAPCSP